MKTLKDAAVLPVLLMLLASVRITSLEEPQGGIIPEARAAMEPAAEQATLSTDAIAPARLMQAVGVGTGQSEPDSRCPVRMKTVRTERGTAHMIVIEVEEVETTEPPAAPVPAAKVTSTTC